MSINKKLEELVKKTKGAAQSAKETIYQTAGTIERKLETKEGIVGDVLDAVDYAKEKGQQAYSRLKTKIETLEKSMYTNGNFDPEKARKILKSEAQAIKTYGAKTGKALWHMAKDTGVADYRSMIPSQEELATKYSGIGTAHPDDVLLRKHLDECLEFYAAAEKAMPRQVKLKQEILNDIKASASSNVKELKLFYAVQDNATSMSKMNTAVKYL